MADLIQLLKELSKTTSEAGEPFEHRKGVVESDSPLTIRVDQKLLLEEEELILTHLVKDYEVDISVSHETEETEDIKGVMPDFKSHSHKYEGKKKIMIHQGLKAGEEVILLKVQGGQAYIVLDRYTPHQTEGEWL